MLNKVNYEKIVWAKINAFVLIDQLKFICII